MSRSVLRFGSYFQVDIQVDKPVLKGTIEPLQFFVLGGQFHFQGSAPILHGPILVPLTLNKGFEDAGEAFRRKQTLLDVVDDEVVEFTHLEYVDPDIRICLSGGSRRSCNSCTIDLAGGSGARHAGAARGTNGKTGQ